MVLVLLGEAGIAGATGLAGGAGSAGFDGGSGITGSTGFDGGLTIGYIVKLLQAWYLNSVIVAAVACLRHAWHRTLTSQRNLTLSLGWKVLPLQGAICNRWLLPKANALGWHVLPLQGAIWCRCLLPKANALGWHVLPLQGNKQKLPRPAINGERTAEKREIGMQGGAGGSGGAGSAGFDGGDGITGSTGFDGGHPIGYNVKLLQAWYLNAVIVAAVACLRHAYIVCHLVNDV